MKSTQKLKFPSKVFLNFFISDKYLVFSILILLFFSSCNKEEVLEELNAEEEKGITIEEAREWFDKNNQLPSHPNNRTDSSSGPRKPFWNHAFTTGAGSSDRVVAPLGFESDQPLLSKGYVSKLVIERDETGEIQMFLVKATGNLLDVESGEFDLGGDHFSGMVEKYTWNGNFVAGEYYENGIKVGTIHQDPPTGATAERLPGGEWVLVMVDWYTQACTPYGCEPMVYSWTETKYVWREDGQSDNAFYQTYYHEDPYSSGGGGPSTGGGSGSSPCSNEPDCFNLEDVDFGEEINYDVEVIKPTPADLWEKEVCQTAAFKANDCVSGIWETMKTNNVGFDAIKRYLQENSKSTLCLNIKDLGDSINGNAAPVLKYTNGQLTSAAMTINLNSQELERSKLSIARTMLHEMYHAQLFSMVVEAGWHDHYEQFAQGYEGGDDFEMLWEYYKQYGNEINEDAGTETWEHEYMADYYIDDISEGLATLHPYLSSQGFINHYTGSILPDGKEWNWEDFYTSLAWEGLQKTEEFQEQFVDQGIRENYNWYIYEAQQGNSENECN